MKFMHCSARACVCGGSLGTTHCGCELTLGNARVAGHMNMDLVAQSRGGVEAGCALSFCNGYDVYDTHTCESKELDGLIEQIMEKVWAADAAGHQPSRNRSRSPRQRR